MSIGRILRGLLLEDEGVAAITSHVFPVWTDTALLPYVVYYREKLDTAAVKTGHTPLTAIVSVECLAADYDESLALAEAVREALDNRTASDGTLTMRSCHIINAEEGWRDDAYIQKLTFEIR